MAFRGNFVIHMMAMKLIQYRISQGCASRIDAQALADICDDEIAPIPAIRMMSMLGFESRHAFRKWMSERGVSLPGQRGRAWGASPMPAEVWDELSTSPPPVDQATREVHEWLEQIGHRLNVSANLEEIMDAIDALESACLAEQIRAGNLASTLDEVNTSRALADEEQGRRSRIWRPNCR